MLRNAMRRLLGSRRLEGADPSQAAFCSSLVVEGRRPRLLYRDVAVGPMDSGWQLIEGSESEEWLQVDGHCVVLHLDHLLREWPELAAPIADEREQSAWSWDDVARRYVDMSG